MNSQHATKTHRPPLGQVASSRAAATPQGVRVVNLDALGSSRLDRNDAQGHPEEGSA